jgi:hypothetical protein
MKRAAICLLTLLALILPHLSHAEDFDDEYGPPPYNDVEDGQVLRLAGYILAPFGYALEWGVTRPMHHAATDTPLAPMLSGDTESAGESQRDRVRRVGALSNPQRYSAARAPVSRLPRASIHARWPVRSALTSSDSFRTHGCGQVRSWLGR